MCARCCQAVQTTDDTTEAATGCAEGRAKAAARLAGATDCRSEGIGKFIKLQSKNALKLFPSRALSLA